MLEQAFTHALANPDVALRELNRIDYEGSLYKFFEAAWPSFDPAPFQGNWHLEAIAEHLEAVTRGDIRKLLINIPPRFGKTLLVSIAWPAWTWARTQLGPLSGPQVKFLCLTYGDDFALQTATTAKRLINSPWYQDHWGETVQIAKDRDAKEQYDTTAGGTRISTSIGGATLGKGGDIKILDDVHKVSEVESEVIRHKVVQTYDEALASRVTDPRHSAEVIVMQRLHSDDVAGHVLDKGGWEHLCLPAEYDSARHCRTGIGWEDPRTYDGELLWPERWGADELAPHKAISYSWAGQYQQLPVARGGGIFKAKWWKIWPPEDERPANDLMLSYPKVEYIIAAVDTAMSLKEEADYSACTVWGLWNAPRQLVVPAALRTARAAGESEMAAILGAQATYPAVILMQAWRGRMEFHELVEKIIATCRKRGVDRLIIEAKANGLSVGQEVVRLCSGEGWGTTLSNPRGDKVSRAYAVQHLFENGLIYAPDREWAQMVIDEAASFPRGSHDDLVDTATSALSRLRNTGQLRLPHERDEDLRGEVRVPGDKSQTRLYDV